MPSRIHEEDQYNILSLLNPSETSRIHTEQEIKTAYRGALLLHHPDKSQPTQTPKPTRSKHTIDQITAAYKILIDPVARAEYDRFLTLQSPTKKLTSEPLPPGLETADLDDMAFDEAQSLWYRGCRCGKERAYFVKEEDLERRAEDGEIVIGCQGCSLWLSVTFAVVEG